MDYWTLFCCIIELFEKNKNKWIRGSPFEVKIKTTHSWCLKTYVQVNLPKYTKPNVPIHVKSAKPERDKETTEKVRKSIERRRSGRRREPQWSLSRPTTPTCWPRFSCCSRSRRARTRLFRPAWRCRRLRGRTQRTCKRSWPDETRTEPENGPTWSTRSRTSRRRLTSTPSSRRVIQVIVTSS